MSKIIVTGIGAISAIGNNVAENHKTLQSSLPSIGKATIFKSKYAENLPFGEIKLTNEELKSSFNDLKNTDSYTRTDLLA